MAIQKKILAKDSVKSAASWVIPQVKDSFLGQGVSEEVEQNSIQLPTAEEIEAIRAQAKDEGFQKGLEEADQLIQNQLKEYQQQWQMLMQSMTQPLSSQDEALENQILYMLTELLKHLLQREIKTSPEEIIPVIREALSVLPENARNIRVLVHPSDADLIEELWAEAESANWKIQRDASLQAGDCIVKSEDSMVDARLEHRLGQLITQFLGDQRDEAIDDES